MFDYFAKHPPETIITLREVAQVFKKSPQSIKRAVQRGELPPPVKFLGMDSWTVGAILKFLDSRLEMAKVEETNNQIRLKAI
jgi:predicted DNA-binding transcriptional regulator AlpA